MNDGFECAVFKAIDEKNGVGRYFGETCADRIALLERVLSAARDLSLSDTDEKWQAKYVRLKDAIRAADAKEENT